MQVLIYYSELNLNYKISQYFSQPVHIGLEPDGCPFINGWLSIG